MAYMGRDVVRRDSVTRFDEAGAVDSHAKLTTRPLRH